MQVCIVTLSTEGLQPPCFETKVDLWVAAARDCGHLQRPSFSQWVACGVLLVHCLASVAGAEGGGSGASKCVKLGCRQGFLTVWMCVWLWW